MLASSLLPFASMPLCACSGIICCCWACCRGSWASHSARLGCAWGPSGSTSPCLLGSSAPSPHPCATPMHPLDVSKTAWWQGRVLEDDATHAKPLPGAERQWTTRRGPSSSSYTRMRMWRLRAAAAAAWPCGQPRRQPGKSRPAWTCRASAASLQNTLACLCAGVPLSRCCLCSMRSCLEITCLLCMLL